MRRPICLIEPSVSYAGEVSNWKFIYTTSINLSKGTRIKFDLQSKGRVLDWQIPDTNLKGKGNLIWAVLPNEKTLTAKALSSKENIIPDFEFILPSEIKAGEAFTICLGTPETEKAHEEGYGTRAQTIVQRRKRFQLFIDPKGKGDYKEPEVFTIDVKGNKLHVIQVIAPSIVNKNKRFDMMLRFEDAYGNLTNNTPEGTLIELTYEHLRENLSWKLFIPETGFLSLPNLYFNEPGIYRIQLQNLKTGEKFYSYPIKCFADQDKSLFWGLLHGESDRVDSEENIEACLRHIRDEKSLQFFSTSSFESAEETSNEAWKAINMHIAEFNEEGRFATFLGMQWFGEDADEGLRMFLFAKDNRPIFRKKDPKTNNLKKTYKGLSPKELISIPTFSMAKGFGTNFSDFTPEFERVVEIYNAWGSSECTEKEGNPRPITTTNKNGISAWPEGSIRKALGNNCRFGFVAGGLDDRGVFGDLYAKDQTQYSAGLTAILAPEQTREALFQALFNRHCYATTGDRIILGFFLAGAPMGSELNTKAKPGLAYNRYITGYVAGTAEIEKIEVIRNGSVIHTITPETIDPDFVFDDSEPVHKIAFPAKGEAPAFVYYYLRILQKNGHIAWSSPIWVDVLEAPPAAPKKPKKKA
ncbi:MAG: DUF3604 domain-containing protein [Chlamydiota bacterium]